MKKIPKRVQEAANRFNGMAKIDTDQGTAQDYGTTAHPLTTALAKTQYQEYTEKLTAYNTAKKSLDAMKNDLGVIENELVAMGNRGLAVVKGRFGADSHEVETMGGVRISERKTARRQAKVVNSDLTRVA